MFRRRRTEERSKQKSTGPVGPSEIFAKAALLLLAFCLRHSVLNMLELNGQRLSLAEISAVANGKDHVTLSHDARTRIEKSRRVVEKIVAEGRTVYGVNTGFGRLSEVSIPAAELRELQLNLVRSTACGVGPPLPESEPLARLLLRANALSHARTAAEPIVFELS